MSDEEFEKLVTEGIDALPSEFSDKLENVVITIADYPTPEQTAKLQLKPWTRLLGLYEGLSLRGRTSSYISPLPDRITIFKFPLLSISQTPDEIRQHVRNTVLHEIAHHFGFTEEQIRDAEKRRKR